MGDRWLQPSDEAPRESTVEERGAILRELLDLTDEPPPVAHRDPDAPTFRQLCERR